MIRIFKVNDCDWVAAETVEQACEFWKHEYSMGDEDLDDPRALTEEEMDRFKHMGDDFERRDWDEDKVPSFRQELQTMIANNHAFPCLFASTEW